MIHFITTPKLLLVLNPFVNRFIEGGPLFMSLILICLILSIICLFIALRNMKDNVEKAKKIIGLASEAGLLGLVLGFFGSIIGMITAFDALEGFGEMNSGIIAGGLKVSFLTVLFGTFTFIISRIGILIYKWKQKA